MKFNIKSPRLLKIVRRFKNKYILTLSIFIIYALFIDDNDIFTIIHYKQRLNAINKELSINTEKLQETQKTLKQLHNPSYIEKYAREKKFFKKDDEDVFVIIDK